MNDIQETIEEIRTVLRKAFPATEFRVEWRETEKAENVDISWTRGPSTKQVDELTNLYSNRRTRFVNTSRKLH